MPSIHRDHSPSPHRALSPLCILLVLPLSLCCSSSTRRSRELCAGAGHYAGPITPCFPKTIRPCSVAAQEGRTQRAVFLSSPNRRGGQHMPRHAPLACPIRTHGSPSTALHWAGGLRRAAGIIGAQHRWLLPASPLLPACCYSVYESPNKLDKTSPRRLLQRQ